ncbi:hypothetical protein CCMA1212_001415 [Trichoderma ghanense]|uniref:Uncharacterized protein n=1 Tax=Trichoderma ghanense TaxID=65468 RepID=A0ABY2HCB0_9HYPO
MRAELFQGAVCNGATSLVPIGSKSKVARRQGTHDTSLARATAIRWKDEPFICAMLADMQDGDKNLRDSIRKKLRDFVDAGNETLRNCIHWSIENLRPSLAVALIDDGVEITNRNLTNRIYNGWTCDTEHEGNGLEGIPRPYTSSGRHFHGIDDLPHLPKGENLRVPARRSVQTWRTGTLHCQERGGFENSTLSQCRGLSSKTRPTRKLDEFLKKATAGNRRLGAYMRHRANPSAGTSASSDSGTDMLGSKSLELIKQPKQMRDIFDHMTGKSSSSDRYIEAYDTFGRLADELDVFGPRNRGAQRQD